MSPLLSIEKVVNRFHIFWAHLLTLYSPSSGPQLKVVRIDVCAWISVTFKKVLSIKVQLFFAFIDKLRRSGLTNYPIFVRGRKLRKTEAQF